MQGYEGTSRTCSTTLTSLSRSPAADRRSSSALHRVFDELHYRPPSSTVTGLVKSDCSTVVLPLHVLKLDPLVQRAFAAALAVKDLQDTSFDSEEQGSPSELN